MITSEENKILYDRISYLYGRFDSDRRVKGERYSLWKNANGRVKCCR